MAASTPDLRAVLAPLLPCLPAAAVSTEPPTAVLPLLSPILRQRVQLLSSSSTEPWLRLLSYDTSAAPKLQRAVQSGSLEPHPVSGEVEVDWEEKDIVQYRRVDKETLQALVVPQDLGLWFRLVYCVGDQHGDGWRVGEIGVTDGASPFASFGGSPTLSAAEEAYKTESVPKANPPTTTAFGGAQSTGADRGIGDGDDDDDDDDDYWARYDATPARTPAVKRSPAPTNLSSNAGGPAASLLPPNRTTSAEDAYFAQYDSVQPAMDNHDPDEEIEHVAVTQAQPPLGLGSGNGSGPRSPEDETNGSWTLADATMRSPSTGSRAAADLDKEREDIIHHPRPESSASSNGSQTVARLEESAGKQEANEFGVKQHVSRSIRSLFMLSRASGIERDEFERLVRTELDMLAMVEEDL